MGHLDFSAGRHSCWFLAAIVILTSSSGAFAQEIDTRAVDVEVWKERGDVSWVVRSEFGLVTSAAPNEYVCSDLYKRELGGMAVLGETTWLTQRSNGDSDYEILRTEDGCTFEPVRETTKAVDDWAVRRGSGEVAYAIGDGDAGIAWSRDGGETFETLIEGEEYLDYSSIEFVAPGRLLVAAYVSSGAGGRELSEVRFFTTDAPEAFDVAEKVDVASILDVEGRSVLWVGANHAGEQFAGWGSLDNPVRSSWKVSGRIVDGVIAPDGEKFWVVKSPSSAGASYGLMRGSVDGDAVNWDVVAPDRGSRCVDFVDGVLYTCAPRERVGYDLTRWPIGGKPEGVVDFRRLNGVREECSSDSAVAEACSDAWPKLQRALRESKAGDASEESERQEKLEARWKTVARQMDGVQVVEESDGEDAGDESGEGKSGGEENGGEGSGEGGSKDEGSDETSSSDETNGACGVFGGLWGIALVPALLLARVRRRRRG